MSIKGRRLKIVRTVESWQVDVDPVSREARMEFYDSIESAWIRSELEYPILQNTRDMLGLANWVDWSLESFNAFRVLIAVQLKEAWGME